MKKVLLFICLLCVTTAGPRIAYAKTHKPAVSQATKVDPVSIIPVMQPVIANYDVYVGGAHLIEAEVLFDDVDGKYRTRAKIKTHGFWYKMLPWDAFIEANGDTKYNTFVPKEYVDHDEWGHKPKTTMLHFDGKGGVTAEFDPPSGDENRELVTAEQKNNTLDPVTALMQLITFVELQKNCGTTVRIFDGKRRFDVTGIDQGTEFVDEDEYGVFKGDARACSASFTMIAGEWKDRKPSKFWQKSETESGRDPFKVYFAPVGPDKNELPIRLESTSMFGNIMVHLTSLRPAKTEDLN